MTNGDYAGLGSATYAPAYGAYGELPSDTQIKNMIYNAFDADPLIPPGSQITVHSDAGAVTLTGTVPDKWIKHAAGQDAWWMPGVTDVRNKIAVAQPHHAQHHGHPHHGHGPQPGPQMAFPQHPSQHPSGQHQMHGPHQPQGGAPSQPQTWPHIGPANYFPGPGQNIQYFGGQLGQPVGQLSDHEVEGIINHRIDVDPHIPADATIHVASKQGVVTLSGTVRNRHIKQAAGHDAWFSPGVHDVHNNIHVKPRKQEHENRSS